MDDAHIFCARDQLESEIESLLKFVSRVYTDVFDFDYSFELSTRPKKFMGDKKDWDFSEKVLEKVLKKSKIKYKVKKGEGAFYGPKIDVHIRDSLGRNWQLATIQLDMNMPKRFDIVYTGKDNKNYRPLVIHRAIFGSLERFVGVLLEHTNGRLPTWLSPIQVRVLSFTDRQAKYAGELVKKLEKQIPDLRIDTDFRSTTIPSKVKDAELMRISYIIVVGDKEQKSKTMAVRTGGGKVKFGVKPDVFIKNLQKEINDKA